MASVQGFAKNWSITSVAAVYVLDADVSARINVYTDSARTNLAVAGPTATFSTSLNKRTQRLYATGLSANTTYYARLEVDGVEQTDGDFSFTTQPTAGTNYDARFVISNCNSPGSTIDVWSRITAQVPSAGDLHFIHTGDFGGYAMDDQTQTDPAYFVTDYKTNYTTSQIRGLLEAEDVAFHYIPDDHGYPDNNANVDMAGMPAAAEAVRRCFPNLNLILNDNTYNSEANHWVEIFGRLRVISPDLRRYRKDNGKKLRNGGMQLIKDEITAAANNQQAVAIVSGVPIITEQNPSQDWWGETTAERLELVDHIINEGMKGSVMWWSGDMHGAAFDDGRNFTYGTHEALNSPVIHGGALDRNASTKGGPYWRGPSPGVGRYAVLDQVDNGGGTLDYTLTQYAENDTVLWSETFSLDVPNYVAPSPNDVTVAVDFDGIAQSGVTVVAIDPSVPSVLETATTGSSGEATITGQGVRVPLLVQGGQGYSAAPTEAP